MSEGSTDHPERALLDAFGLGRLDEAAAATVEGHVTGCASCQAQLEALPEDPFVTQVRRAASPAGPPVRLQPGYEILEEIGRGGMAVVYRARQGALGRVVALKRIQAGAATPEALVRFRQEAEAVARLTHPNIVQVYDVGDQDGQPYLALELVEGEALAGALHRDPLPAGAAAALVATLARAMDYAHQQGVVHRDLKPANILLQSAKPQPAICNWQSAIPKITDFGLALRLDAARRTQTGAILGTPSYMAPEQAAADPAAVGPAADVYALGAILYECLTGRPPFRAATVLETLDQVRGHDPVPPRRLQPGVPRDLETICLKCLAKDPRRRYASAAALAEDLLRFHRGEPIRARPVGRVERLVKGARRRPAVAAVVTLALVTPLGAVGGVVAHNARLRAEVERADQNQRRAEANYRAAHETVRRMLSRVDLRRHAEVPRLREFFKAQAEDALAFYTGILEGGDLTDPALRWDLALAYREAAYHQYRLGQHDDAQRHFRRAVELGETFVAEQPGAREPALFLSYCLIGLGNTHLERHRHAEAEPLFRRAFDLRRELLGAAPDDPVLLSALSVNHTALGHVCLNTRRKREGLDHYRQAVELDARALELMPDRVEARRLLAESYLNYANCAAGLEPLDTVRALYPPIEAVLLPLVREQADMPHSAVSLAGAYINWGNLVLKPDGLDAALARYAQAEALLTQVLDREPGWGPAREYQYLIHGARAQAYEAHARWRDALASWERAVELSPASERRANRLALALAAARSGDHARATGLARELAAELETSPDDRYNLACVYALVIPGAGPQGDSYRGAALDLLERLAREGYFDDAARVTHAAQDADLAALRDHPRFRQLLKRP